MSLRAFFIFTSLRGVAGKVEGTGGTARHGLITKWMFALADIPARVGYSGECAGPAETRENARNRRFLPLDY
jgi:hypothetical protein